MDAGFFGWRRLIGPAAGSLILLAAGCAGVPPHSGMVYPPPPVAISMTVQADTLNLRQCPDTSCQVTVLLYRGEEVAVRQQNGMWSEVETKRGAVGWVASRYLGTLRSSDDPAAMGGAPPAVPEEELAAPVATPPAAAQPPEISEEFSQ